MPVLVQPDRSPITFSNQHGDNDCQFIGLATNKWQNSVRKKTLSILATRPFFVTGGNKNPMSGSLSQDHIAITCIHLAVMLLA